jgi:hypothetical protein
MIREAVYSDLFKYKLSISALSVVEKEFGPILVGKLMMLLRLKECKILSS